MAKKIAKKNKNGVAAAGILSFKGENVALYCANYIYTGRLLGVNVKDGMVQLEEAGIVYETGPLTDPNWKDVQRLTNDGSSWYVMLTAVESFGPGKVKTFR